MESVGFLRVPCDFFCKIDTEIMFFCLYVFPVESSG